MGDVQGPEKVNDTCVKTLHVGTMDRGFIVLLTLRSSFISSYNSGYLLKDSITNYLIFNTFCFLSWVQQRNYSLNFYVRLSVYSRISCSLSLAVQGFSTQSSLSARSLKS
jgi:hypothetical protein